MESSLNEPLAVAAMGVLPVYMNCFPQVVFYSKKHQKQNSILKFVPQTHTQLSLLGTGKT